MARNRALKQKDIDRLRELSFKHPGALSEDEKKELEKLNKIREKYGEI